MGSSTPSINLSIIANSAFESFTNTHSIPIKLPRTFKMDVGDSLVYCPVYAVRTPLSYISHQASFYSAYPQNDNTGIIKLTSIQPFFGAMGCTSAIVFTCFGAAYGTAKSGVGICAMGVDNSRCAAHCTEKWLY